MSSATSQNESATPDRDEADPRRWQALAVLGLIQFMLVLDMTVVNVALPRIQHDLKFSPLGLAWVVNGYVLMAGGLLLLGGRMADIFGRRRVFLAGVSLFALASIVGGAAVAPAMLVSSRFAQGAGEAMAAPAALGLIVLLFPDAGERVKALGIWGGIAGLGGVSGTVISGALTDLASWRWIFYINVPIAAVALIMVPRLVTESKMDRSSNRIDYAGAILATGGLVSIVDGLLQAADHAWGDWQVLVPLIGGVLLLVLTALVESRVAEPLIPLRFFENRTRVTANIVGLLSTAGFFTYVFLETLYQQQVLDYSPLRSGLSYLPLGLGLGMGIGVSTGLMPKLGVKPLLGFGFLGMAVGLVLASNIHTDSTYVGNVLPGMLLTGFFAGMTFPAIVNAALHEVTGQDSSLGSAVQNATQQVGGALGLAVLVTLALRHAASQARDGVAPALAATHGYALSFRIGAGILVVAGLLVFTLLEHVAVQPGNPLANAAAEEGSGKISSP